MPFSCRFKCGKTWRDLPEEIYIRHIIDLHFQQLLAILRRAGIEEELKPDIIKAKRTKRAGDQDQLA